MSATINSLNLQVGLLYVKICTKHFRMEEFRLIIITHPSLRTTASSTPLDSLLTLEEISSRNWKAELTIISMQTISNDKQTQIDLHYMMSMLEKIPF